MLDSPRIMLHRPSIMLDRSGIMLDARGSKSTLELSGEIPGRIR